MKTLFATILEPNTDLSKYADAVNNGATNSVYFYVNGNTVSVYYTYGQLSEEQQAEYLSFFLANHNYTIK